MPDHPSSSHEQSEAEALIRAAIAKQLNVDLEPESLTLPEGARVEVDGVADDESALVEIFAHQGRLRGAQFHKVARDALKLITLGRTRPEAKLVLAFADDEAAKCVTASSWLAEALRAWKIDVLVVQLDDAVLAGLRAAQVRQVMANPPLD